jgi:hypothetical protein
VRFDHATGDPTLGDALLTLVTDQGAATGSPGQMFTIALSATLIDSLDLNGTAPGTSFSSTWTGDGPVGMVAAADATLSDNANANLDSLTATLDDPQVGDVLGANTSGTDITAAFVDGMLSLTGSDTVANYQAVLRTLTYTNTNGGPGVLCETVHITADDGVLAPATAVATIIIDLAPPIIDLNGSATDDGFASIWTPAGPVHIASASTATLTDADSANLVSLTAVLDSPRAGDQLAADTSGTNITASFNNSTLSLIGSDTAAHYQQVLRTITYDNTNGGPGVPNELVELTASDGALASPTATAAIAIDLYPPVIDLNGAASGMGYSTFWTNRGPVPVTAEADATIGDADSANLTSLTVALSTPHVGDLLTADTSGTAISASFAAGTLSLSGSDTVAHYQQVFRTISYDNSSGGPNAASETIQFTASDGALNSTTASAIITIDVQAPVVDLNGQDAGTSRIATWTNTGPVALAAPTASITDSDSTMLTQMMLTFVGGFADGDVLSANTAGSNITANFADGTLMLSGSDTVAHYQQVLRSVAFDTATIVSGSRTVQVVAYDDGALASNPVVATIHLDLQAPILSMNGQPAGASVTTTWTNHGSVAIAGTAGATLTDPDSATLTSLTAAITTNRAGDVLTASTAGTAIGGSFANGTLILSGSDTVAHYQQVLSTIAYDNLNGSPGIAFETINLVATDDGGLTTAATATIRVKLPPVLSLGATFGASSVSTWSGSGPVDIVDPGATIFDLGVSDLVGVHDRFFSTDYLPRRFYGQSGRSGSVVSVP